MTQCSLWNAIETAIHWQDCFVKNIGRSLTARKSGKSTQLGMSFFHRQNYILRIIIMSTTMSGWKKVSLATIWVGNKSKNKIDLEELTPLINRVYSGCTQRESKTNLWKVMAKSDFFAKITTTDTEAKSQIKELRHRKVVSWSYDKKRHPETCAGVFVNWRTNPWTRYLKFQHLNLLADNDFEKVGELANVF